MTDTCLLFLHGLQTRKEIFLGLQKNLTASFSVPQLSFDLLGFGLSDKPGEFSYDLSDQLEIVVGLLKKLGIGKAHIIGHSLGGMLGTLMLKAAPEMVQSLVSLEGNLCAKDCGESLKVANLSFENFKNDYYDSLKSRLASSKEPSASFRHDSLLLIPDYVFYRTSQAIVSWSKNGEWANIFEASEQPKLMVYGKNGTFYSRPSNPRISSAEISNSGHFMILDNLPETTVAIKKFLQPMLEGTPYT